MEAIRVEVPKELHGLDAPLRFTYWPPVLVLQQFLLRMPKSQLERMHWNFEKCGTTGAQQVFSEFHTGLAMQAAGAVQTRLSAQHTLALAVYSDAFAMCDRFNGHPFYMECFNTADNAPMVVGLLPDLKKKGLKPEGVLKIFHFCMGKILEELKTASAGLTLYALFGTTARPLPWPKATFLVGFANLTGRTLWFAGSEMEGRRCLPLLLVCLCDKPEGKCYGCRMNWFSGHPCSCCSCAQGHMWQIERGSSESMPITQADAELLLGDVKKAESELKQKMAELQRANDAKSRQAKTVRALKAEVSVLRTKMTEAEEILKWSSFHPVQSSFGKLGFLDIYAALPVEGMHDTELGLILTALGQTGTLLGGKKGGLSDINQRWKVEMSKYTGLRRVSRSTLFERKKGIVATAITFRAFELRIILQVFPYLVLDMDEVAAVWFALWELYVAAHATEFTDASITTLEETITK